MSTGRRLLVIGLDGATYRSLRPMVRRGVMPILAGLLDRGTPSTLLSTVPPITASAWTTMFTGANPGRHRVFGFFRPPDRRDGRSRLNDSSDVRIPCVWDRLSAAGLSSGLVGVPMTYPPTPIRGLVVATAPSHARYVFATHPAEFLEELRRHVPVPSDLGGHHAESPTPRYVERLLRCLDLEEAVCLHVMRARPWDCFVTVSLLPDLFQHYFWRHLDPSHEGYDAAKARAIQGPIDAFHARLDRYVGTLIAEAGPDASVLIVSDHGFGPLSRVVHVNSWLEEQGLLRVRSSFLDRVRAVAARSGLTTHGLLSLAARLDVWHLRKRLSPSVRGAIAGGIDRGVSPRVDWRRSDAVLRYCVESGVFLRPEARGRAERVRDGLRNLRDPDTGKRVFDEAYLREELYEGPEVALAPDILLMPAEGYMCSSDLCPGRVVEVQSPDRVNGFHRLEGVLLAAGPGFRRADCPPVLQLADVGATILRFFGLPIPPDVDGRAAEELLDAVPAGIEGVAAAIRPAASAGMSDEEEDEVRERLASLGYL